MNAPSERNALLKAGAGLALVGALALSACAPDDDPADFEETEPASAEELAEEEQEDQTGSETAAEDDGTAGDEEAENDDDSAQDLETEGDDAAADEEDDDPAGEEGSGAIDPEDAVETVTYPIAHDDVDGEITVGFHHLRVEDQTMELLLTYTPEFDDHGTYNLWHLHNRNHAMVAPALYDRENLKRYNILRSGGDFDAGHWATNQADVDLASGETQAYWANFAVPEDDIAAINIGMPVGPEFKDMEIDWGEAEPSDQDSEAEDFDEDEDAAEDSGDEDGE